ncbi:SH3 domain-containing protein [Streptomyces lomondensis]|uniref:SH3 domain-containing protein n=1 Tax=Streptomyces lomondensis TaxID=68229 RepID=UPI001F3C7C83|nr:SH3 domain-containing protein [Streptomyces lomondensis]MCF0076361.1 SH3 domain-containing protein [Streptomyces lomondensis]
MSLRSRLSIATAAGLLAAAAAVTPAAAAHDDWDPTGGNGNHHHDPSGGDGHHDHDPIGGNGGHHDHDPIGGNGGHHDHDGSGGDSHHDRRLYKGVVTASTLALRSAPNRGSQIIRYAHRGDIVRIFCKTGGEKVKGNPLWYLLTDGTWAWGAARYIDNIGPAPRWC